MVRWICVGLLTALALTNTSNVSCHMRTANTHESAAPGKDAEVAEKGKRAKRPAEEALPEETSEAEEPAFARNAFPPTVSDTDYHRDPWRRDCLRCHETGVQEAPRVVHRGMPAILTNVKCRSCHVLIPGSKPRAAKSLRPAQDAVFAKNAFPPMIPNSNSHMSTWTRDDCLLCHESGLKKAPVVRHEGLPRILLKAKCRSCHVQVRAAEAP